jgi:hypothetical protein
MILPGCNYFQHLQYWMFTTQGETAANSSPSQQAHLFFNRGLAVEQVAELPR